MNKISFFSAVFVTLVVMSCGSSNSGKKTGLSTTNATEDKGTKVNVIEQAKPAIMVIPSDQFLQRSGFLKTRVLNGKGVYERDYSRFMLNNTTNKNAVRAIQNYFIKMGYPLNDLEQSLKALENQAVMDDADGTAKDAKTLLVASCHPDIILEFDFNLRDKAVSRSSVQRVIDYTMAAIDAFSNKSVASFVKTDISGDLTAYLEKQLSSDLPDFVNQIKTYFADIVTNGREITFRVAIDKGSAINLSGEFNDMGDTYADWIRDWVKANAKNGTAALNRNTAKEMYYTAVRITNNAEDGTQFNAYDFANAFRKEFVRTFHIKATNSTQGLGDAYIIIK